jgi:hypothetical protein
MHTPRHSRRAGNAGLKPSVAITDSIRRHAWVLVQWSTAVLLGVLVAEQTVICHSFHVYTVRHATV